MDGGNITIMAQRTYLIFRDIEGKLDTRRVECTNAPAAGRVTGLNGVCPSRDAHSIRSAAI